MTQVVSCLTVYFDDPFWAALYERWDNGQYEVCRTVFGAELKDYQVYEWLQTHWRTLKFSSPILDQYHASAVNPKRMQRQIQKQLQQREQQKETCQKKRKEQKEKEKEFRFLQRQEKRKQKHKGR